MSSVRQADNEFEGHELLFRRFSQEGYNQEAHQILDASFEYPHFSVNRQKHSDRPEDVISPPYERWGFAEIRVNELPEPRDVVERCGNEPEKPITIHVVDAPEPGNKAHAEVRLRFDGDEKPGHSKPRSFRKKFRIMLAERFRILKLPSGISPPDQSPTAPQLG